MAVGGLSGKMAYKFHWNGNSMPWYQHLSACYLYFNCYLKTKKLGYLIEKFNSKPTILQTDVFLKLWALLTIPDNLWHGPINTWLFSHGDLVLLLGKKLSVFCPSHSRICSCISRICYKSRHSMNILKTYLVIHKITY